MALTEIQDLQARLELIGRELAIVKSERDGWRSNAEQLLEQLATAKAERRNLAIAAESAVTSLESLKAASPMVWGSQDEEALVALRSRLG